jgi:pimeloyl-ACP methyl ester carboxylesterase
MPSSRSPVEELAHAAAAFLDAQGIEKVTLVGNSMGCPVICEFGYSYPDRLERAILVSPAGGINNQPLPRAVRQLSHDGIREPVRLLSVAVPDYVRFGVPSTFRMFRALTRYPSLDRLLGLDVPTLVVAGNRDPLMPDHRASKRSRNRWSIASSSSSSTARLTRSISPPGELANVIRQFMDDRPIVDDPNSPGNARAYEIHRGIFAPKVRYDTDS